MKRKIIVKLALYVDDAAALGEETDLSAEEVMDDEDPSPNIYDAISLDDSIDGDMITGEEEGFMLGYLDTDLPSSDVGISGEQDAK